MHRGVNYGPAAIFLAASMWASDGIFRQFASTRVGAVELVMYEHIVGIVPLLPLAYHYLWRQRKQLCWKVWLSLVVIGVGADALANTLITLGFSLGHVALVALLQQTQPFFGVIAAYVFLNEGVPSRVALPLMVFAFVGLCLMMTPFIREASHEGASEQDAQHAGIKAGAYGLGAAVIWASESVLGRYLLQYAPQKLVPAELLTYRQFIGLTFLIAYASVMSAAPFCPGFHSDPNPSSDSPRPNPPPGFDVGCRPLTLPSFWAMVAIATMALLEVVSHFLYFVGLHTTPTPIAVVMELANPMWMLTAVPYLIPLFDPAYVHSPLESEQVAGAVVLMLSTVLLGIHTGHQESGAATMALMDEQDQFEDDLVEMMPAFDPTEATATTIAEVLLRTPHHASQFLSEVVPHVEPMQLRERSLQTD